VLLSGDNALVIALACRGLHGRHRVWGMVAGSGIAVALRIAFTGIVATLMALPYLKLIGGLALLVIAAKLLVPEDENDEIAAGTTLWHAVRIVALADLVMSLDNVIAVAAAANGQASLLIIGLAMSIPLIIAGAALIMLVLDRFPLLVWLGAMLLGWVAGEVIATDPAIEPLLHHVLDGTVVITIEAASGLFAGKTNVSSHVDVMETLMSLLGAGVVLVAGSIWRGRALQRQAAGELEAVPARGVDLP
ncbi:YjbE family putative metal transport protein, partial [Bradyrhizobium sp.]|jgi:YjbE family integral membrane protein